MTATAVLLALVLAALAAGAGWLVGSRRSAGSGALLATERSTRERAEIAGQQAAAEVRRLQEVLSADRVQLGQHLRTAEAQTAAVRAELSGVLARAEAEQEAARLRVVDLQSQEVRLAEKFEALSAQALDRSARQLVELAKGQLGAVTTEAKGALEQRKQAVEALVAPLSAKLGEVEVHLRQVEEARTAAYAGLTEQVGIMRAGADQLRLETAALVTALRAPQTRGRWGELQLRRVVELAGMVEQCDFTEQTSTTGTGEGDGLLRPDMVIRLAGGKSVVVDAKVPFAAYLEAMEAREEQTRTDRRKAHARHFGDHVKKLAGKEYWTRFDSAPEFVIMFVPADAFLDAALQVDAGLQEEAFRHNVVLATPSTLIGLLRTIAYTWRQERLAENARQISTVGKELYDRLATLGGHLDKIGKSLGGAVKSYNDSVGSLEARVFPAARKLADLDVSDAELVVPRQVETTTRALSAPELVADAQRSGRVIALPVAAPWEAGEQTEITVPGEEIEHQHSGTAS